MQKLKFGAVPQYDVTVCKTMAEAVASDNILLKCKRLFVLTDNAVAKLYLGELTERLSGIGIDAIPIIIPHGEQNKSFEYLQKIYDVLLSESANRSDFLLNLGGGMVSDLGGFSAATYMRGIGYINMPTTVIGMIDSSIGGKTAVNYCGMKNIIGAFHSPSSVLCATELLNTLPEREFSSGMGEILKYAVIGGEGIFAHMPSVRDVDAELIYKCCAIKNAYVSGDEHDNGKRHVLNLGHTYGHAFEAVSGYCLSHGEAVGLGILAAARLGMRLGITAPAVCDKILTYLTEYGMEYDYSKYSSSAANYIRHDKKNAYGTLDLVLIRDFGDTMRLPVKDDIVEELLLHG